MSSSPLGLRDDASRSSTGETDSLTRISVVFSFDGVLLNSQPYRAAVTGTWRQLGRRRQNALEPPPPSWSSRSSRSSSPPAAFIPSQEDLSGLGSWINDSMPRAVRSVFHGEWSAELKQRQQDDSEQLQWHLTTWMDDSEIWLHFGEFSLHMETVMGFHTERPAELECMSSNAPSPSRARTSVTAGLFVTP